MVSILSNPLATPSQLAVNPSNADGVPSGICTSLLWAGSSLIQSAGVLLHLPQTTIVTAIVFLQRFYLLRSLRSSPLIDSVHAAVYLSSKLTEHPVKPRSIINVTTYLIHHPSPSPISPASDNIPESQDPGSHFVPEHEYLLHRTRMLNTEAEMLKAFGFQTWCALPYTLVINYAQALDCLDKPLLQKAMAYLNDALMAPSLVYLTHQPHSLAVAAMYLAARADGEGDGVKLPEGWWEVFDVEREELGFLVAVFGGVGRFVREQAARWKAGGKSIPWDLEALEQELQCRS